MYAEVCRPDYEKIVALEGFIATDGMQNTVKLHHKKQTTNIM